MSQRGLASRAGVSATTIARIETCVEDPTVGTLLKLLGPTQVRLTVSGLTPTTFLFGIVDEQRDRGDRHAPPHRLNEYGFGYWDRSPRTAMRRAERRHRTGLALLQAMARIRGGPRR